MLKTGRSIRNLGKKDLYRVLRWGPMAVADLVAEFFDTEPLRATIATRGIFGTFLGPWSAGSALVLLLRAAADATPAGGVQFPAGGAGAITLAMAGAAKKAGAEIRTGVDVAEIRVKDGVAGGVVLVSGEEISARAIVSNADPKRTLMHLVDPAHLSPDFMQKIKNYRCMGTVAKINLALSALPEFTALNCTKGNADLLKARIQISPEIDYLERAFDESKYGNFSSKPYIEIAFPSLSDPSLAPAGQHVMSIYMQYAPYKLKTATGKLSAKRSVRPSSRPSPSTRRICRRPSCATRSSRRRISKKPTVSPAATSSTGNLRSISSSPCVHCWTGRAIERRS